MYGPMNGHSSSTNMLLVTSVHAPTYVYDYLYVKSREVWPAAVIIDAKCNVRMCMCRFLPSEYGYDIYPSQQVFEDFVEREVVPTYVHVNLRVYSTKAQIVLTGDPDLLTYLRKLPVLR